MILAVCVGFVAGFVVCMVVLDVLFYNRREDRKG